MRCRRLFYIGSLGLLMCFLLAGCQHASETTPQKLFVGVARYDGSDVFISELTTHFEQALRTAGHQAKVQTLVTTRDAADSSRLQNQQVKELLAAGCNVLAVNLVDRTNAGTIIELAKAHDVPVIFFNREPVSADLAQWSKLYYIGADAADSGIKQGQLAASAIKANPAIDRNHDGKIQYVVLEGEHGHQDAIMRTELAVSTLEARGVHLDKLGYGIANWQRTQAENRMEQLIAAHQNQIELVLSNNDDMALGGLDAYAKLNDTASSMPIFFGIDGTAPGLKAVASGQLAGTVYNDKESQAKAMAQLAVALQTGHGLDQVKFDAGHERYFDYYQVTKENVARFLTRK